MRILRMNGSRKRLTVYDTQSYYFITEAQMFAKASGCPHCEFVNQEVQARQTFKLECAH